MRDGRGLSEHEFMREVRLPNWGFCGRHDTCKPDNERGASSIYERGKSDGKATIVYFRCRHCKKEQQDEGVCCGVQMIKTEERISPEPPPPPADHADAEVLDAWIKQLAAIHYTIIRERFYLEVEPPKSPEGLRQWRSDTDAAVRALLDVIALNRKVVNVMKYLGWT